MLGNIDPLLPVTRPFKPPPSFAGMLNYFPYLEKGTKNQMRGLSWERAFSTCK